jgi:MoxR-like ATPase
MTMSKNTPPLRDIADLHKFDTWEWTEYLTQLPADALNSICTKDHFRASVKRVQDLCAALKKAFVQKDELIDLMCWAAIAHLPMLMLGPWGTAKSMLVRTLSRGLGIDPERRPIQDEPQVIRELVALAKTNGTDKTDRVQQVLGRSDASRYFEYLVTRFSTPEELLGPVNVELMLAHSL